eukprot:13958994-Alexandrium_andersonii.AAC.1
MADVAARALPVAPASRGRAPHRCSNAKREAADSCSCWSRGADHWTLTSPVTTRSPSRGGTPWSAARVSRRRSGGT